MNHRLTKTASVIGATGAAAAIALVGAAPAHADNQSYLDYIKSRGQNMLPIAEGPLVAAGHRACGYLHKGESPEQVAQHFLDPSLTPGDVVVDAARHELCPDKL